MSDFIWLKEKKTKRKLNGHVHIVVIDTKHDVQAP